MKSLKIDIVMPWEYGLIAALCSDLDETRTAGVHCRHVRAKKIR